MQPKSHSFWRQQWVVEHFRLGARSVVAVERERLAARNQFAQEVHMTKLPDTPPIRLLVGLRSPSKVLTNASRLFSEPVGLQAVAQRHTRTVEHHPQVALRNIQQGADFLAFNPIYFTQVESGGNFSRQLVGAIAVGLPKHFVIQAFALVWPLLWGKVVIPYAFAQKIRHEM